MVIATKIIGIIQVIFFYFFNQFGQCFQSSYIYDWLNCWSYLVMYIFFYTTQCLQIWALKLGHERYCSVFCDLF